MGGRALKTAFTRRYDKQEFLALKDEVVQILDKTFGYKTVPLYYREKETFGDLDVIISWGLFEDQKQRGKLLRQYIQKTFNPTEIYHTKNSNSWSFDYKECQVDFIMCPQEDFWCYYHYFSYNDLGNFIGVLARNIGLKYGQEGLVYDHYFKGKKVGRLNVSKNNRKILEFLDLDYIRFMRGFDNMQDIFNFVMDSKYYNAQFFQLSNLNKINRERNLKRASYMSLLEYIEANPKDGEFEYVEDKTPYIELANKFFPEFNYKEETRKLEFEITKTLYVKSKFNGDMIKEKYKDQYDIDGKKLGKIIGAFKAHFESTEEYNNFILESPIELIFKAFEELGLKSI